MTFKFDYLRHADKAEKLCHKYGAKGDLTVCNANGRRFYTVDVPMVDYHEELKARLLQLEKESVKSEVAA